MSREDRIAENEATLRAGNEAIYGWPETQEHARRGDKLRLLCECASRRCVAELRLTAAENEAVRSSSRRFAMTPGHQLPEVESVVEEHDGYVVVEKAEHRRADRPAPQRRTVIGVPAVP